jgi:hypothetical protein
MLTPSKDALGDACVHCDVSLKVRGVMLVMLLAGEGPLRVGLARGTGDSCGPLGGRAGLLVPEICEKKNCGIQF